ncbi:kinase-like protein [Nemania abortiva]|nr:kinase-like protein [Nemania abortiva]
MLIFTLVFRHVFSVLGHWAKAALSLALRLLLPNVSATFAIEPQDQVKPRPIHQPPYLEYIPVYGEWEREHFPNLPDDRFKIPATKEHDGQVYYVRKGDFVGMGTTALVERLPSGDAIVKTPLQNPLNPIEERMNREGMVREAEVYHRLMNGGDENSMLIIPNLLGWDAQLCALTLGYQCNGDLANYIKDNNATGTFSVDLETRGKWATQAARALVSLHDIEVIHADVAPRNFLLNDSLDLCICDFAGSFFPGSPVPTSAPGSRYQARSWGRGYVPTEADDIFGLGSVLYFIITGNEPYDDLDDVEVERRFQAHEFPETGSLWYGSVIDDCWNGKLTTARAVVQALNDYNAK